jgi:hypothetical protein
MDLQSVFDSFSVLTLYLGNFFDTQMRRKPESFLSRRLPQRPAHGIERPAMQDVTMLLFTVVFFGLAFLYVKACQKLR